MKVDEPFNSVIKSTSVPSGICFKLADETHFDSICCLMSERNPLVKIEDIQKKTKREIFLNLNDPEYRLFVAILDDEVVGFCRFFHSRGLAKEKIKFDSPEGWYGMGILVSPRHRRKSIARFLFQERIKILESLNASALYSIVDVNNKTSIKMHEEFGFREVSRARGFLHLEFPNSSGILFKLDISKV